MFVLFNASCGFMVRPPVRVAVFPRPGCELIWVAKEKGYFKEEGLDVVIAQYSSWVSALNAFNQGKVDISIQTVMSLLVSGRRGVIVAVTDRFKGDVLVGKRTMKSVVDLTSLKRKPVSAEIGTDGYYLLESVVQQLGLARKEISIFPQFTDDAVDSFIRGDIQAVVCYPPYVKKALRKGKGRVLYAQEFHALSPATVIVAPERLIAGRPGDVRRFIRAWYKAVAFFKNHREEAIRIMAKAEGVTPEEFAESLSDLTVFDREEARRFMQSDKMGELVSGTRDFLYKLGMPIGKIDLQELVDARFVGRRRHRQ
jgi:NitT/TauT family transport system substrate-binding protein